MAKFGEDINTYDALVSAIYDVVNDPGCWGAVLDAISKKFRSHVAVLQLIDIRSKRLCINVSHGHDELICQNLHSHLEQFDYFVSQYTSIPESGWVSRVGNTADDKAVFTGLNLDSYSKLSVNDTLACYFVHQRGYIAYIGLHRTGSEVAFSMADEQLMRRLIPHLQRALSISRDTQAIRAQSETSADALNCLPFGVVLVNRSGTPVVANNQARVMNEQENGFHFDSHGLCIGSFKDTQALRQLICQATQYQDGVAAQGGVLSIRRGSLLPLSILVSPLNSAQDHIENSDSRAVAAVFISDHGQKQEISAEILCGLYGLSKAESRLAKELAQGHSLDEICNTYHLSKNTLRSQLKAVFSKTGLSRQSDIVRLVLGSPAILLT